MKIFVAGPFNHLDQNVKDARVRAIAEYCVKLFNEKKNPISALLMGLSFASHGSLSTDTKTWEGFSGAMVRGCDEVHVLMLDGWEESSGIKLELEIAEILGIPVKYIEAEVDLGMIEITTFMEKHKIELNTYTRPNHYTVSLTGMDLRVSGGFQSPSADGQTVDEALKALIKRFEGQNVSIRYGTPFPAPKFTHTKLLGK